MKPVKFVVVALLAILMSTGPAIAESSHHHDGNHGVPLNLTLGGTVVNAGTQEYHLSGGQLVQGSFGGSPLTGHLSFSLDATVQGLSVSGEGSLQLSSGNGEGDHSWGHDGNDNSNNNGQGGISAEITITDAIPAAIFPLNPAPNPPYFSNCDPTSPSQSCNSEIPLMFTGLATVSSESSGDPVSLPIGIESAYWNPLGGSIVITSLDSPPATFPTLFLIVNYDSATIEWSGVQLVGDVAGTFGTGSTQESVTGTVTQTVNSFEDLVRGQEFDTGSIAFSMSDPSLSAQGFFFGHSSFSLPGLDCTQAPFSFPLPPGTCTATGLTSDGAFFMHADHGTGISGTYHTDWSTPALFVLPSSTVVATVSQH